MSKSPLWHVVKRAGTAEYRWTCYFDHVDDLHPDSRAACISGGTHATQADALAAALEGIAETTALDLDLVCIHQ